MPSAARSRFLRYAATAAAVLLVTGLRWGLSPYTGTWRPLMPYLFAILACSAAGLGPSILAVVLSTVAGVLFMPPEGQFRLDPVADVIRIVLFAGVGLTIAGFAEAGRRARARLQSAAEQRSRVEGALRASERRLLQLADTMPQIVWTAVPDGSVDYFNARFYEYTGLTPDAALAPGGWRSIVHPDDLPRLSALRDEAVGRGEIFEAEVRVRDAAGGYRWHLLRSVPVHDESGRLVRRFGTATDVDDLKRAGEALREADRRKDEFLALLAHELRNPLAPIRNALHLLGRSDGGEPDRAMAERQVVHLARLVDDLMDVSRIATGKIELRKEVVDLATVARRAVESARPAIDARGHALEVELPAEPTPVEVDPTRLEQILWNLLSNAAKYTDPGGTIRVQAAREGDELVLRVEDTGIGIEPAVLPRVFEMFVQAHDCAGRAQGGLGIGLSLVKSLVELHDGRVEARSRGLGTGSTFEVRLPVAQASERPRDRGGNGPRENDRLKRRRVLVVDDNVDAADSLGKVLTRIFGQEVRIAHDGPSALRSAEEFRPEVVVLDIGMPGMDGYEVARHLRDRPDLSRATLVALTGWGQESDRKKSRLAGIDHHLVKPVEPETLRKILAACGGADAPA